MIRKTTWAGIACAFGCATAWAGLGVWSGQGPYGGYIFDILRNPSAPATLYTSTRSGIFKSIDDGFNWAPAMNGIVGSVAYGYPLAIDAGAANTLYTIDSTGHVYRTTDGAANWLQTGYVMPPVGGFSQVNQLTTAVGPGTATHVYMATTPSGILVSIDGGATFDAANGSGGTALPASIAFQTLAVDPANSSNLLAGTVSEDLGPGSNVPSLYRSTDAGAHWTGVLTFPAAQQGGIYNPADPSCSGPTPPPYICAPESYYATVTQVSFGSPGEVYALLLDPYYGTYLYRSGDSGATWNPVAIATSDVQNFTTTITADAGTTNSLYAGGYYGLMHSIDGGATFSAVTSAANGLSPNGSDIATASRLLLSGSSWYFASQEAGMFKSTDSGVHWSGANNGIEATNIRALGMVPNGSTPRILAGYGDAFRPSPGIYAGFDAGDGAMTWANSNSNLRAYQIRAITVDPATVGDPASTVVYSGGRSEQVNSIAPRNGGVYKSSDGGSTWTTIDTGMPLRYNPQPRTAFLGTVRSIVIDPQSCPGYPTCTSASNTVYATSNGCYLVSSGPQAGYCGSALNPGAWVFRVFKSTNGGATWSNSDNGIPGSFVGHAPNYLDYENLLVVPLVIDPSNPNTLYAGTSDSFDSSQVTNPTLQTGVYKSTDGGASWSTVNNGLPTYPLPSTTVLGVLTMAIHPTATNTLWASVIDINQSAGAPGHIYKTTDGGTTWNDSSTGLTSADIRAMLVDPVDPNIIYAAGGGTSGNPGGVFKSYDGGATWHSISIGLPADAALALALDPADHTKLYAGTSSGVWEITETTDTDLDGVSDAQEDEGPNTGDSNFDGIPDRDQSYVTYVPPHQSAAAPTLAAPNSPNSPTVAFNDSSVSLPPPQTTECAQAQDVQAKSAAAYGPDVIANNLNWSYDVDLIQFEVLDCASTTVKLVWPNFTFGPGWSFRFYGPLTPGDDASIKWYDFSQYAVKLDAHSWQVTLTRGAFGSYRPASTGSILFLGGPGYSDRTFANGFD